MDTRPQTSVVSLWLIFVATILSTPRKAMEMEGLENDPNFWNEFDGNLSEDDVPVVDLTSWFFRDQVSDKAIGWVGIEGESCRDGLPKPPAWTKKRVETSYPSNELQAKDSSKAKSKQKPKPKVQEKAVVDKRLQHLEALHEGTNVKASIQLSEGRRIKIDGKQSLSQKKCRPPQFDFDFANLREEEPLSLGDISAVDLSDDDDLPEPYEILNEFSGNKKGNSSSETSYTNPEMDALIREMPSPVLRRSIQMPQKPSSSCHVEDFTLSSSSPPTLKRPVERQNNEQDAKRAKFASQRETTPLFLAGACGSRSSHDEDFELDDTLFDLRPASPLPKISDMPSSSQMVKSLNHQQELATSSSRTINAFHSGIKETSPKAAYIDAWSAQDPAMYDDDYMLPSVAEDLAELEAFLNSDAVIMVDNMDDYE
ncbi:hypothetical protein PHLCEN_2v5856 [Hermanssonia centrifuga]|uniref:Uncharacterized protein n=1 Tax=Hermanssonia centrifuga TaxID=98765 RepID=A0A2R6P131_9APHY|nr:hypothetical protein PHLCEN_2v5856 [Hermanssonia centrifuga]